MWNNFKKIIGVIIALMAMLSVFVLIFVVPAMREQTATEENDDKNVEVVKEGNSILTPVCTIPVGSDKRINYKYFSMGGILLSCDGPSQFEIGSDGEFVILDTGADKMYVYAGNDSRFTYSAAQYTDFIEVFAVEDGYIINYICENRSFYERKHIKIGKNGIAMGKGEWYKPEDAEPTDSTVSLLEQYDISISGSYARLLKVSDDGYYISKRNYMDVEGGVFYECYVGKYNFDGERLGYSIYDYKHSDNFDMVVEGDIQMDDENNIYHMRCYKDKLVIYKITLGNNDENDTSGRMEQYIADCDRYTVDAEAEGLPRVQWTESHLKNVCVEDEKWYTEDMRGELCYIIEMEAGEILIDIAEFEQNSLNNPNSYYIRPTGVEKTYKLADDVEVWAWENKGMRIKSIMAVDYLFSYEGYHNDGNKVPWRIYFNDKGEVQYICNDYS